MGDTDDSVFHVDQYGYVSIQVARGTGVPCTECRTHHAGICTFANLLLAQMSSLQDYAEVFLPAGAQFHELRGALYTLMGNIYTTVTHDGVKLQSFDDLQAAVLSLKARCDVHLLASGSC